MTPGNNKVNICYFKYKGHSQRHKVMDFPGILKGFISWVRMPNIKSVSLTIQKLWLRFLAPETDRQTHRQYKNKMPSNSILRGIKIIFI